MRRATMRITFESSTTKHDFIFVSPDHNQKSIAGVSVR